MNLKQLLEEKKQIHLTMMISRTLNDWLEFHKPTGQTRSSFVRMILSHYMVHKVNEAQQEMAEARQVRRPENAADPIGSKPVNPSSSGNWGHRS